jgi:Protein of unknown function (DUF4197)
MLNMKKVIALLAIAVTFSSCDVIQQLPTTPGTGGISSNEAAQGIREALSQGVGRAVGKLNVTDGFFKDAAYKVLLPPDAKKIENTLRSIGMGSLVDKAILQINRGAEQAAGLAKPIFLDAIKSMTIQDAIGLVKNGDTSATNFFRVKTTASLMQAFTPVIQQSLENVEATKYYDDIVNKYNNLPTTIKKINPDLSSHVAERATAALFDLVAKEEVNIRTNFAARSSDLLKKVFGETIR